MGKVSGRGTLFYHKNITQPKSGSHFVGQKRNHADIALHRFLSIQTMHAGSYVFESEEQLVTLSISTRQF